MHTDVQIGMQKHRQIGMQTKTSAQFISEKENISTPKFFSEPHKTHHEPTSFDSNNHIFP